jgi:aminopeptidase N
VRRPSLLRKEGKKNCDTFFVSQFFLENNINSPFAMAQVPGGWGLFFIFTHNLSHMKNLFLLFLFSPFSLLAQNKDISYLSSGGKLNPLQAIMDVRHYTISLEVDIDKKSIEGFTEIDVLLSKSSDTILFDLVHLLTVRKIMVNNKAVQFQQQNDKIYISANTAFAAGKQTIKIFYGGEPPIAVRPPWFGGFTFTKDRSGNPWVAINCQKEGARVYFPCKDHPSDEPNEGVDMFITVPDTLVVAAPGLLQNVSTAKNKKTYHWKTNYTISGYTTVFNIGKYKVVSDEYTTINGNKVPVQFYVLEEDVAEAAKIIELKKRDSKVLEKYFGEYPWVKEKIGIAEVPNPGMEHQTMITFQNKFEYSTVGGHQYSANLFHEYAHEWFANKVTNKDWAHEWIQEGIATYAEALIYFELGGQEAYDRIIDAHKRSIRFKKAMVQGEEISEDSTYNGSDIYTKGSFMMHSLRYIIGDDIFLATLKKLATDPQYTYDNMVTTTDVEQLFSKASGQNLKPFFDFYTRTTDVLDILVKQTGYQKYTITIRNLFMPLPIDITTPAGTEKKLITKDGVTITSAIPPVVDGRGYYLKKVTVQ